MSFKHFQMCFLLEH